MYTVRHSETECALHVPEGKWALEKSKQTVTAV
jgi:hypothetical protein